MNLQLASVAGACIDMADREGTPEQLQYFLVQPRGALPQGIIGRRPLFRAYSGLRNLQQDLVHG
jgi:hypothetical protein